MANLVVVRGKTLYFSIIVADFLAQDSHGPDQHSFLRIGVGSFPHHGQERFLNEVFGILGIADTMCCQFSQNQPNTRQLLFRPVIGFRSPSINRVTP